MAIARNIKPREVFIGKLNHGADILEELVAFCENNDIKLGKISAIGAVKKACIGFYDQKKRKYNYMNFNGELEITSLIGNVSLKDGKPFIHAHITLSDKEGRAFGGHLAEGTIVFACEFVIEVFEGDTLERGFDEQTGLSLWKE